MKQAIESSYIRQLRKILDEITSGVKNTVPLWKDFPNLGRKMNHLQRKNRAILNLHFEASLLPIRLLGKTTP